MWPSHETGPREEGMREVGKRAVIEMFHLEILTVEDILYKTLEEALHIFQL